MVADPVRFRFDSENHEYIDLATGDLFPSITQMLKRTGWVDDAFFTEESCERGTEVHRMTAEFDLGALDVDSCVSPYRGYLLSHVSAVGIMRATMLEVEVPKVHPVLRFAGRPDRVLIAWGARAVVDGKSGAPAKSHQVQTALQAILDSVDAQMPPEAIVRYALYWGKTGKFKLVEHRDKRDFDEAFRILKVCCQ